MDKNTGTNNSGHRNSGDLNSGDLNSGHWNSGDWNSGHRNSGHRNSGDWNSGHRNSGIFNTNEPKMRAFNKDTDITHTEFRNKHGYSDLSFPLNTWIKKEDMTEEEKSTVKGCDTMGGYLKTLSYKEAWSVAWESATKEEKDWFLNLPNFDASIFKEITGIDVSQKSTITIGDNVYDVREVESVLKQLKPIKEKINES